MTRASLKAMVDALRVDPGQPFVFMGSEFVLSEKLIAPRKPKEPFRAPMRKTNK